MKVKTKVLTTFLKKVKMTGTQAIGEAIFRFEKEGLKISANSEPQQARVMAWLNKSAFVEYEEFGNVGMNDLANVIKVLERFGETITIKKEGNLLSIKGDSKAVDIELVNENFLQTDTNEPSLEFTDTFETTATKLGDVIKDVVMNKDAILTVKTGDKTVSFTNTGKYKFNNTFEAPMCKGGVNVSFGQPFIDCVNELEGTLNLSVRTNYPCKVIEKLETSTIAIIIAPRVEEEEA